MPDNKTEALARRLYTIADWVHGEIVREDAAGRSILNSDGELIVSLSFDLNSDGSIDIDSIDGCLGEAMAGLFWLEMHAWATPEEIHGQLLAWIPSLVQELQNMLEDA